MAMRSLAGNLDGKEGHARQSSTHDLEQIAQTCFESTQKSMISPRKVVVREIRNMALYHETSSCPFSSATAPRPPALCRCVSVGTESRLPPEYPHGLSPCSDDFPKIEMPSPSVEP